jgi:predicted O-linked N-acetylglucosamine transferase (SPINDLY family)
MDYYLADRHFLPRAQFEAQFTEQIVHLPSIVAFQPFEGAPAVNALPALKNGYMTFGSFNRQSKISSSVIEQWSKLLRALPESRMVLGGLPKQDRFEALAERFASEGIAPERLSFHARSGMDAYLDLHRQVDLCLDTFAYNGGTTTLHALWMGVPTLTIAGETAPRRGGATFLGNVGLEPFIARDAEDFLQEGLHWAAKLPALARVRRELRKSFAKSALGQPALVTAGLERALRIMWQRWCAGLPPEAFDVASAERVAPRKRKMRNG